MALTFVPERLPDLHPTRQGRRWVFGMGGHSHLLVKRPFGSVSLTRDVGEDPMGSPVYVTLGSKMTPLKFAYTVGAAKSL